MWEWLEDLSDWWTGDDDSETYVQESVSDSAFSDMIESDPDFADFYNQTLDDNNIYDQEFWDLYNEISYADQGGEPDDGYFDYSQGYEQTFDDDISKGGLAEFLSKAFGGGGQEREGNKLGKFGQGLGSLLESPLMQLLLMNQKNKDSKEQMYIPKGQEAYGGAGEQPSYQNTNTQHTLLPGMAYANSGPPGMQAGGLTSIPQGNKGLPNLPQSVRNNMGYMQAGGLTSHNHPQLHSHGSTHPMYRDGPGERMDGMGMRRTPNQTPQLFGDGMQAGGVASLENIMDGPGDITQAMLEPGEFVMTRKATENLTPEYLYDLMHQALSSLS